MKTLQQIAAVIIVLCHGSLGDSGEVYCKDAGIPDALEVTAMKFLHIMSSSAWATMGPV
jgi:hypothetical protein